MATFTIQRGATALCAWDVDSGRATFHPRAAQQEGLLVLAETEKLTFVLSPPTDAHDYRVWLGDVPLSDLVAAPEDAGGISIGGQLFWREFPYFESARGHTRVLVETQASDANVEIWVQVIAVDIYILPSKLGEASYKRMAEDIENLSRSLLLDLYGKSKRTYDLRFAKGMRAYNSREQELDSIESVLDRLSNLLHSIARRPASRIVTTSQRAAYWGGERLPSTVIRRLAGRGVDMTWAERPVSIMTTKRMESFDVPEHRVLRSFLDLLASRADYCAEVAQGHIRAITSERHLRHIRLGAGSTLYESIDLPKIRRLELAVRRAEQSSYMAKGLNSLWFLRSVKPELIAVRGGAFQRNSEYRSLFQIIRAFLLQNAVWYKGDELSGVTKLTSRLFEQWCYLQVVEAFRASGVDLREWSDALRQNLQSRFILDFDRGLMFEGSLSEELRIRLRYEPWILGNDAASKSGETLCRGSVTHVPWSPDIVVECLRKSGNEWLPVYAIVLDCKYTLHVRSQQWDGTVKYLEIRSTATKRQVVRQLWLIALSRHPEIQSHDPAVTFSDTNGPSCPPDEAVHFQLTACPGGEAEFGELPAVAVDPFKRFAAGTCNFLRRHFGAVATGQSNAADTGH